MKKSLLLSVFLILLFTASTFSQSGQWIWMKGDSTFNSAGNYDLQNQGVFDPNYEPIATTLSSSWTDKAGHFWLFGGRYYKDNYGDENFNTLWQFDPAITQWALMRTSNSFNAPGKYGMKGVSSPTNIPGGRSGAVTWVDSSGALWLFGGGIYFVDGIYMENRNDLWKYDITTNEWTWMNGSKETDELGVYGTKGVPDATNTPGARSESATWVDSKNNLWLFGGKVYHNGEKYFNDLWKYDLSINEWTWISGTPVYIWDGNYQNSWSYGQKNIGDTSNLPPSRHGMAFWSDSADNFYLFGGYAYYDIWINEYYFNDTWKYSTADNVWTWIHGDSLPNSSGISGPYCQFANDYRSNSRFSPASWKDNQGKFWMMGGRTRSTYGADIKTFESSRDVWCFDPSYNQWMKTYKDSSTEDHGFYGEMGVANINNDLRSRRGAVAWVDSANNFWIFGGSWEPNFMMNDLWKYTVDSNCGSYPTGEFQITSPGIRIFPNPANDILNLQTQETAKPQYIEIKNILGNTVLQENGTKDGILNIDLLLPGIYIVVIRTSNSEYSAKFIKQ